MNPDSTTSRQCCLLVHLSGEKKIEEALKAAAVSKMLGYISHPTTNGTLHTLSLSESQPSVDTAMWLATFPKEFSKRVASVIDAGSSTGLTTGVFSIATVVLGNNPTWIDTHVRSTTREEFEQAISLAKEFTKSNQSEDDQPSIYERWSNLGTKIVPRTLTE